MDLFFQGIIAGLGLAILVGPLLFALIQESIERGSIAGLMVGLGIWLSDALFIAAVYFGMHSLDNLVQWPWFTITLGVGGSIVLFIVGLAMILKAPPDLEKEAQEGINKSMTYGGLMLKGFLINTINPFTVFFWITITTTVVLKDGVSALGASSFYAGILGTIIFTDSLKIFLAKKIRHKLRAKHIVRMRKISGGALIIFGIVLIIRAILFS